jgi:hypothetical protein
MTTLNEQYEEFYSMTAGNLPYFQKAVTDRPSHVLSIAARVGGEHAVMALFDAILDAGHRNALVQALNSPSLPQWVREKLEVLLYGNDAPKVCALLATKTMH